jgi:hypothetical protein
MTAFSFLNWLLRAHPLLYIRLIHVIYDHLQLWCSTSSFSLLSLLKPTAEIRLFGPAVSPKLIIQSLLLRRRLWTKFHTAVQRTLIPMYLNQYQVHNRHILLNSTLHTRIPDSLECLWLATTNRISKPHCPRKRFTNGIRPAPPPS